MIVGCPILRNTQLINHESTITIILLTITTYHLYHHSPLLLNHEPSPTTSNRYGQLAADSAYAIASKGSLWRKISLDSMASTRSIISWGAEVIGSALLRRRIACARRCRDDPSWSNLAHFSWEWSNHPRCEGFENVGTHHQSCEIIHAMDSWIQQANLLAKKSSKFIWFVGQLNCFIPAI